MATTKPKPPVVTGGKPPSSLPPKPTGGTVQSPPAIGGRPPEGGGTGYVGGTPLPTPGLSINDMINALSGSSRDAFVALETLFNSYGLGSLVNNIFDFIQNGYSQDTITVLLQQTPEYKQRFAGNEQRIKNGLAVLSPAEYLATEASYYQVVKAAGLPASFYDNHADWNNWIGNDVSASEVQSRVQMAQTATEQAPADLVQALGQMGVPKSSLVAYFLDDTKALPLLQQQFNAAQIGAAALRNNLVMDPARATMMANMGISADTANTAYQQIGESLPTLEELGRVYNQNYNQQTAENAVLLGNAAAQLQTTKLETQERAAFSGGVGTAASGVAAGVTQAGRF